MHECYNSEDQIWVRMHARHLLILYYLSASSPLVAPIVIYFYATLENLNRSLKSLKYFLQITFCSYHLALIVSVSLLVVQEAWKQGSFIPCTVLGTERLWALNDDGCWVTYSGNMSSTNQSSPMSHGVPERDTMSGRWGWEGALAKRH